MGKMTKRIIAINKIAYVTFIAAVGWFVFDVSNNGMRLSLALFSLAVDRMW
jgi:hypothetical protein